MKMLRAILSTTCTVAVLAGCSYTQLSPPATQSREPPQPQAPATYTDGAFGELTDYGDWVHTAPYGWAWQPYVGDKWAPFIYGQWIWSDWGWTWVSYEEFGWAVYHYGNWVMDPIWGWIWVPGYEWFPHRVEWVWYDAYVCWAPLPPVGVNYDDPWMTPFESVWVVCNPYYFTHVNIANYIRRDFRPRDPLNDVAYVSPGIDYISQETRKTVRTENIGLTKFRAGTYELQRMKLPTQTENTVKRYRPQVRKRTAPPQPNNYETREKTRVKKSTGKPADADAPQTKKRTSTKPKSTSKSGKTRDKKDD